MTTTMQDIDEGFLLLTIISLKGEIFSNGFWLAGSTAASQSKAMLEKCC